MKENNDISLRKAALIYAIARYSTVIINLIITAILSRLLLPSEYSIVALVTVFSSLFAAISNMGIGTGIIQFKILEKSDFDDLFSFSFYISLLMVVCFIVLGYPISVIYSDSNYVKVFGILSVSVFFTSLNAVPDAILLREKRFMTVGMRMIITTTVSGFVAVILAFLDFSYYALLLQMVISSMGNALWNIKSTRVKLQFRFRTEALRTIFKYSSFQFAYNLLNYFAQNLDNLLIPKTIGAEDLAYYNKSYTLMRYPINLLPHAISPVLHPVLSNYQNDKEVIYIKYIQVLKILSILGIYISIVCFFYADEIIRFMFGPNWSEAVLPFQVLSLCIWAQLINAIAGSIYQSLGKTDKMFISGMIHVGITVIATLLGAFSKNLFILSICIMISLNLKFFVESFFLVKKCFEYSLLKFYLNFVPDLVNFILLFVVGFFSSRIEISNSFVSLVVKCSISLIVYVFILIISKQKKYIVNIIGWKRND